MQLYLGCTLVSNLIHSLMLSNMFSAGGGAIYDAPKARGGAIFDAHKPRGGAIFVASKPQGGAIFVASRPWGGAIFVAYHWNVLIKKCQISQKKNFHLQFIHFYIPYRVHIFWSPFHRKKQHQNEQILLFGTHFMLVFITVSAQIEQRCSNFCSGFFGAVAFKFGKSAVIIKMLL